MKQLSTYEDVLPRQATALALVTDGTNFTFNPNGTSESGRWKLSAQREFAKVLIYKKVDSGGEIYLGDYQDTIVKSKRDEYSFVRFKNAKLKGLTAALWTEFTEQPNGRSQRVYLPRPKATWTDPSEDEHYSEGTAISVTVNKYERNPKARKKCLDHFGVKCKVCDLSFAARYGVELGAGFIHVHHIVPLSKIGKGYKVDPVKDLVPVCPNCHAMLHKGGLSPNELRARIKI